MTVHMVQAKGILSPKNGMNLYRGCQHGCIYCDSRSRCYHMDHAFEDIEVKENAPELLEQALRRKRKRGMLSTGSMTDPYLPLERELGLTRKALELAERYGYGFTLITKSDLVLRDLDLLKAIQEKTKCVVQMTLTTLDEELCKKLEPGVCTTARRLEVLEILKREGIPTVVWLCPILPFLNDTEANIRGIGERCGEAGVWGILCFGMGVTLRDGSRDHFYRQLDRLFPGMKERYIRTYGERYVLESPEHARLMKVFFETCDQYGMIRDNGRIFSYLQTFEEKGNGEQLSLFDGF